MEELTKKRLIELVKEGKILFDEPMKKHTTFKIGGNADVFIVPESTKVISDVISFCKEEDVPYMIIGKGSNLLVGDKGIRGVVICIYGGLDEVEFTKKDDDTWVVTAGAGIMLSKLSREIAQKSLKGFEFAAGIPGTLGGAVTMNAGAYEGEIKDNIVSAKVMDSDGNVVILSKDELDLSYRHSVIQDKEYIVLEATFKFEVGEYQDILDKINDYNKRRRDKQPLEYPSAGSTFKRPEGHFAGKLIMDSGLKGFKVGDACVSEKHCGFVINLKDATAADTIELMKQVNKIVYEKYNVHLEPEVRIIGEF